jgi:hypothetical protein
MGTTVCIPHMQHLQFTEHQLIDFMLVLHAGCGVQNIVQYRSISAANAWSAIKQQYNQRN